MHRFVTIKMNPNKEASLEATVVFGDSDDEQMKSTMNIETKHASNDEPFMNFKKQLSPAASLQETMVLTDESDQNNKDDIITKQKKRIHQLENEGRSKDAKIQYLEFQLMQSKQKNASLQKKVARLSSQGGYFSVKTRPKDKARADFSLNNQNSKPQQARSHRSRQRSHSQPQQQHPVQLQSQQPTPHPFQIQNRQQPGREPRQQPRQQQQSPPNHPAIQQTAKRGGKKKPQRRKPPYKVGDQVTLFVNNRWNVNKWMNGVVYLNRYGKTHAQYLSHYIQFIKKEDENEKPNKTIYLNEKVPYEDTVRIKPIGTVMACDPPTVIDYK